MTLNGAPFDPVVSKDLLGEFGSPIGENNGESEGVYPLAEHPGWLLKVFKAHLISDADTARIDQLVALAATASASDRELLGSHSSWPAARVTSTSHKTYGVVLAEAPPQYWVDLRLNHTHTKYKPLEIDWLAATPEKCRRRGVPVPSFADRVQICTDIVAVAEFLERKNLVYGDWSYANTFWSADKNSGYVIDLDGCTFGTRTSLGTQNWDDPRAPGKQTDTFSDRYGVALLLARCLTSKRDVTPALDALCEITAEYDATHLYDLVRSGLIAPERGDRPTVATLLGALSTVRSGAKLVTPSQPRPSSGVVGWTPVQKGKRPNRARPTTRKPNTTGPTTPKPRPLPITTPPTTTPRDPVWRDVSVIVTPPSPPEKQPQLPPPTPGLQPPSQDDELNDLAKAFLVAVGLIALVILLAVIFA